MIQRLLVAIVLAGLVTAQDQGRFDLKELTYVTRIGGQEVAREHVELDGTRVTSKAELDLFGTQKSEWSARLDRRDGSLLYHLESETNGREIELDAKFADDKLTLQVKGGFQSLEREVANAKRPFIFENLMWASNLALGRELTRAVRAGGLKPGPFATAIVASQLKTLAIEIVAFARRPQAVRGEVAELWVFDLRYQGGSEITLTCAANGLPLRFDAPTQKLTAVAVGFETVRAPLKKPITIVDAGPWRAQLSKPKHEVDVAKKVMVAMRDGVELAVDVYRPKKPGRYPTILARTPYRRQTEGALKGDWFARRGYVFVAQDVRGRFDSEGKWFPLKHEAADGSDSIDWIAEQAWSDGKVGMIGASYVGWVQWFAASTGNPRLKAIVPQVSPPDPTENIPYDGGCFLMSSGWWARVLENMRQGKVALGGDTDWNSAFATQPLGELDTALGLEQTFLDEWLAHPPSDVDYWRKVSYRHLYNRMDLPVLHISGWFDGDQPGAILNFPGMRKHAKTERARNAQYLVMGPWTHAFNTSRSVGAVDFGDGAVVDLDARILRFFDRYLKGVDNGIDREDPVLVFTLRENSWHAEKDWPLPQTEFTELYLSSDGNARRRDGDGSIALEPDDRGVDELRYDPANTRSIKVDFNDMSGSHIMRDYAKLADRANILDYTSPALAGPVELTGPFRARLSVSTDAADTDFAIEVFRLTPKGEMFAIAGGIQRLRYRTGEDAPVKPGTVVEIEIDCWATSVRLDQGDRIRVQIGSSLYPGFARHTNTLEPIATASEPVIANNRVHHDAEHRSYLLLPVVPRDGAAGLTFARKK